MTAPSRKLRLSCHMITRTSTITQHYQSVPKGALNQDAMRSDRQSCWSALRMQNQRHNCSYNNLNSAPKSLTVILISILFAIAPSHHLVDADYQDAEPSNEPTEAASSSSSASSCFGGLQIFEKISMSSFESLANNPNVSNTNQQSSSFVNGVLIQQDDQALTSECLNICRSQANCLSFVIDYNKFECKSYATTQQELQHELDSKFQHSRSVNPNQANQSTSDFMTQASTIHASHLLPSASSNYFEKVCLEGVAVNARQQFSDICGANRLWAMERVVDSFLDGFVERELPNVNTKDECSKMCLFESSFVCRSADFDSQARLCRLSKEDRRTQPQAMRQLPGSGRHYLENQCGTPGPSTCVYELKKNVGIISMDALKFAQSLQDCQMKCNQETSFNCRSYSLHQQRCFLSGDDSTSLNSNLIKLPQRQGWHFGEKKCLVELCSKGIFSYERISGFTLRSALSTPIDLMGVPMSAAASQLEPSRILAPKSANLISLSNDDKHDAHAGHNLELLDIEESMQQHQQHSQAYRLSSFLPAFLRPAERSKRIPASSNNANLTNVELLDAEATTNHQRSRTNNNLAITQQCRHSCDLGYLNCPAFTLDYKNNRCQRLDRNSQGRHQELVPQEGYSYYEKICLRVPEIMSMCQDRYWIFERVLGHELAPHLYEKAIKFVQSRRDCQEYCLEEKQFTCRSALYNDETSDCKLSSFDRRLVGPMGGYYRNFNSRISYLENQCVRDHQAAISMDTSAHAHQQHPAIVGPSKQTLSCSYEQASEQPSYPTFTEHIEMVPLPATTGNTNQVGAMSESNVTGVNYCKQLCNANENFECHSFGYYAATAQCFLSADDTVSAGTSAASPSTGFTYFEKRCRSVMSNTTSNNPNQNSNGNPSSSTTNQPDFSSNNSNNSNNQPDESTPSASSDPYLKRRTQPPSISNSNITIHIDQQMNTNTNNPFQQQPSQANGPDQYKCGVGHKFVYQRISGFEPIGGYLTLLIRDNNAPGIVSECAHLCRLGYECRAFVVDYNSNQCFAMLENSSVGLLSLRQTIGKDYFEGFCVPEHLLNTTSNQCGHKTWVMDKIVDQAAIGVQHQRLLADSDRVSCRRACLEERLFYCKSAMFDSAKNECKLFSIDRESVPQMRLSFTRGVDFYENQCQISTAQCPYDAIERDITMVTAIKSLQARSALECEQACNLESTFNCRSYTYHDHYPSLPNVCLLSSDSRSTSQRGSVREQSRTLYAERNCYFRRARYPGIAGTSSSSNTNSESNSSYNYQQPSAVPRPNEFAPQPEFGLINQDAQREQPVGQTLCEAHHYTFERTFGYDFRLAPKERAPIAPTVAIAVGCQQACLKREKCQSFVIEYGLPYQSCFLMDSQVGSNRRLLTRSTMSAYFEKVCLPRTGVDPAATHSPMKHHSHMPLNSHANSLSLGGYDRRKKSIHSIRTSNSAYTAEPLEPISDNIAPSYSANPWAPTGELQDLQRAPSTATHTPYYYQQHALVHNYPSRSCAKLWSFERFIMHNFTAEPDKVLDNFLSRAQCEAACLNEASFMCRSGTFDYSLRLCRLFKNTRRTLLSQFVDLESTLSQAALPTTAQPMSNQLNSSHGIATIIPTTNGATSANNLDLTESLNSEPTSTSTTTTTTSTTSSTLPNSNVNGNTADMDYFENTCVPEPSSCQYRIMYDLFSPYIDKITHAISLSDCQRQCDLERLFACKSINYDPASKNCMLINEDLISLNNNKQLQQPHTQFESAGAVSHHVPHPLIARRGSVYGEKGNCEMISVQCTSQEMLVSVNFDAPFRGRIMAKGNPDQCFVLGDGQTSLHFPIVFGPKCNSRQEGHNTFTNEIVVQQHPVIMTESDKTVRVMCAFEAPEQTISLAKNSQSPINKTGQSALNGGIDVNAPEAGLRTRHNKQQFSSVVSSKAPPPTVVLRILDSNGRDAQMINLGDDLMLRIQMHEQAGGKNSALGIFARNLVAKSSSGESLLLIDHDGCPVDPSVFSALEVDLRGDGKSLQTNFKAFRFPSSGMVNFEVQIRFCPERCPPVDCQRGPRMRSYGRRKRDVSPDSMEEVVSGNNGQSDSTNIIKSVDEAILRPISQVMKPGKAFQFVRELMLQQDVSSSTKAPQSVASLDLSTNNDDQDGSIATSDQDETTMTTTTEPTVVDQQLTDANIPSPIVEDSNNQRSNAINNGNINPGVAQRVEVDEKGANNPNNKNSQVYPGSQAPYGRFPEAELSQDLASTPNPPQARDLPLKFSILVAENQQQQQLKQQQIEPGLASNWVEPPIPTIMNSSDVDLDHIVIPGNPNGISPIPNNIQDFSNKIAASKSSSIENNQPILDSQTLDATSAASSNSIQHQSINIVDNPGIDRAELSEKNSHHRKAFSLETHESAASKSVHTDCPIDGGLSASSSSSLNNNRARLWTIIWTGTFVILVNVCLVILSLVLYFKRLHASKNHNIMFAPTTLDSTARRFQQNCNTSTNNSNYLGNFGDLRGARRGAFRWPSVLSVKSKNIDLSNNNGGGATSLDAHEHFFSKLNNQTAVDNLNNSQGTTTTTPATTISNDYGNWTNLSRDSSLALTRLTNLNLNSSAKLPVLSSLTSVSSGQHRYAFDPSNKSRDNSILGARGLSSNKDPTSASYNQAYQGDFNRAFKHNRPDVGHL